MGDGSAIGGWLLTAAIVTVLAGGVGAAAAGRDDEPLAGGLGSNGSAGRTAAGTGVPAGGTTARTRDATLQAKPCTRVGVIRSRSGSSYHQFPMSAAGSPLCLLRQGDRGAEVTVMQRALKLCSNRSVPVNGVFDARTRAAVAAQQRTRPQQLVDGVYGPLTANLLRWPWIDASTRKVTGECARMGDRAS
jgi:hypothetical protein